MNKNQLNRKVLIRHAYYKNNFNKHEIIKTTSSISTYTTSGLELKYKKKDKSESNQNRHK